MNLRRIAALSGFAAAGILILSLVLTFSAGAPPALDDPARDVAAYYEDNQGILQLNAVITFLGIALIPLWFVPIYRWIRDRAWVGGEARGTTGVPAAGDEAGTWATIAFAAFVATGAVVAVQTGVAAALAQSIEDTSGSDEVVTAVFDVFNGLGAAFGPLFALFALALAMSARGTGYIPNWCAPVLLIAALASLLSILGPITESDVFALLGLLAFVLFIVVVVASSMALMRPASNERRPTVTAD